MFVHQDEEEKNKKPFLRTCYYHEQKEPSVCSQWPYHSICSSCLCNSLFCGRFPYDLMSSYCVGYPDVKHSFWYVVDAINALPEFRMSYPADHEQQRAIAESFRRKSAANFECCAGAVDGILVWIHKPSEEDCAKAGCSEGKFFCGRKHKFGLNCQAVCDSRGKF